MSIYDPQVPAFNTQNRQPTNLNPLDEALAANSDAAAVWSKVRSNVTTLAGTFAQINTLADNLFARVTQIEGDTRLTPAAKAQDITDTRNSFNNALEGLRRNAEAARAAILDVTNPLIDASGFVRGTTSQDTLVMIERTRDAWTRCMMVLDRLNDGQVLTRALEMARTAAERNESFTMSALRQNLEAYLEARNHRQSHEGLVMQLNHAMGASASPAMRAAMQIQEVVDAGWRNLQSAFLIAERYGKDRDPMRVTGLPGWPNQPPVNI